MLEFRSVANGLVQTSDNGLLLQVGIGAFVVNSKREVLVVQERLGPLKGTVSLASTANTVLSDDHSVVASTLTSVGV